MGPYSNKHTKIESAVSTPSSYTNHVLFMLGSLIATTLVTGLCLSSSTTSASTEVIDQVSLTVPIACTMSGTGTTHTATLNPGTYSGASGSEYENGIGKTTLTAICNDDNGFSIYAIGYTGNSYDSENHTKLVGSTTGGTISTKAYTSGDTTSNWSMKLTKITDSAESYNPQNLTIQSDTEGTFASWHSVPDTYTKVAEYHANTGSSTTDTTLGIKLETTYAAYISSDQPADTYTGQVKYTMVHPSTHIAPVVHGNVTYNSGELTFAGGNTTNVVNYQIRCETDTCEVSANNGAYEEPNHFKGSWVINGESLADEDDVKAYISTHVNEIIASGFTVTAANPYAIVYDGNGASAGTMNGFATIPDPANPDEASGINNTVDLMAPNYKKSGYGFAGWSENPHAIVNGSDTIYGPNQNVNAGIFAYDEDSNKSAVLYAVWVQSAGIMQNWSGCSALSTGQVTALTDNRDGNVYTVGKLADGNCWTMENLKLADKDLSGNSITINSSNTNNPAPSFTTIAQSSDMWCKEYDDASCLDQNKVNTNNTNLGGTNASNAPLLNGPGQYDGSNEDGGTKGATGDNYSWYGYGNYYNWYTATAGNGTISKTSGDTVGDICPAGWGMPTSESGTNFYTLDVALGGSGNIQYTVEASNRWRSYPNNFVYAGGWDGDFGDERGISGGYWSRTGVYPPNNANVLGFYYDAVYPIAVIGYRGGGLSVRCIFFE